MSWPINFHLNGGIFYEDDDASLNENHTKKIRRGKAAERKFPVLLIPPPNNNSSARKLKPRGTRQKITGVAPQNPVFSLKTRVLRLKKPPKSNRGNARKTICHAQKNAKKEPFPIPPRVNKTKKSRFEISPRQWTRGLRVRQKYLWHARALQVPLAIFRRPSASFYWNGVGGLGPTFQSEDPIINNNSRPFRLLRDVSEARCLIFASSIRNAVLVSGGVSGLFLFKG